MRRDMPGDNFRRSRARWACCGWVGEAENGTGGGLTVRRVRPPMWRIHTTMKEQPTSHLRSDSSSFVCMRKRERLEISKKPASNYSNRSGLRVYVRVRRAAHHPMARSDPVLCSSSCSACSILSNPPPAWAPRGTPPAASAVSLPDAGDARVDFIRLHIGWNETSASAATCPLPGWTGPGTDVALRCVLVPPTDSMRPINSDLAMAGCRRACETCMRTAAPPMTAARTMACRIGGIIVSGRELLFCAAHPAP